MTHWRRRWSGRRGFWAGWSVQILVAFSLSGSLVNLQRQPNLDGQGLQKHNEMRDDLSAQLRQDWTFFCLKPHSNQSSNFASCSTCPKMIFFLIVVLLYFSYLFYLVQIFVRTSLFEMRLQCNGWAAGNACIPSAWIRISCMPTISPSLTC